MHKKLFFLIVGIVLFIGNSGNLIAQTSPAAGVKGYYVNLNGQQTGPFTEYGLQELVKLGFLTNETMVWKKEMPVWELAGEIEELSFLISSPLLPLPEEEPLTTASDQTPPPVCKSEPKQVSEPAIPSVPFEDNYVDFTVGQRWAAFGLNFAVPGLGSFAIMRDSSGGFVNFGLGFAGYAAGAVGTLMFLDERDFGIGLIAAGAALYAGALIQNIVWSTSYHRPRPRRIALMGLDAWNIVMVPGKKGIESLALSYTLHY
jgi:hypothetical protein